MVGKQNRARKVLKKKKKSGEHLEEHITLDEILTVNISMEEMLNKKMFQPSIPTDENICRMWNLGVSTSNQDVRVRDDIHLFV